MVEPVASRPYMPGYGTLPAGQGTGLLPWTWALARLRESHDFWLATVWPDGRPHLTPVWAVWDDGALWFSASPHSRKMRNIRAGSAVSVSTEDPENPVVLEGTVERIGDRLRVTARLSSTADDVMQWADVYDRDVKDIFAVEDDIAEAIVESVRTMTGQKKA